MDKEDEVKGSSASGELPNDEKEDMAVDESHDSPINTGWVLKEHVKDSHFDVTFTVEDDSRLLRGVYEYGMGNSEPVKMDPNLKLGDKILPDGEQKPQANNLQTRFDYLLAALGRITLSESSPTSTKENKKVKKPKSKHQIIDTMERGLPKDVFLETSTKENKKVKKPKSKHQIIDTMERGLPKDVFLECKEQMRPVKRYLMKLNLEEEKKSLRFSRYLLKIGIKVSEILKSYSDPEKKKEWRSNLWYFVSNFSVHNQKQLYRIYRQTMSDYRSPGVKKGKKPLGDGSKNKIDRPSKKKYNDQQDRKIPDRKERYLVDFKSRDHCRNYPRDGGNFQRGKPHRNDGSYSQDRQNNGYHGSGGSMGGYDYGMGPSHYSMPSQPPPAHSGCNYGPDPPLSQPLPSSIDDHIPDSYGA